ncbi:hypothetical protein [Bradyrhizobium icense]|uniref:hypothetical protein n=1 Tax=Bradyrhizobium icense TaxID=1274631 RepID=UPI0012EA7F87|nr:hypothetical protein [Bradyrhizobium icense]
MAEYWCSNCKQSSVHYTFFFTPKCENCAEELEEERSPEPYIVDFKEIDIGPVEGECDEEDNHEEGQSEDAEGEGGEE